MNRKNVLDSIGNTPLVKLDKIKKHFNLTFDVYAKLERNNPSGSVKDRAAKQIILDALKSKEIDKDSIIVEATSGNTGISIAMICAYLDLKCILVMPESASIERRQMMAAFGAELILTKAELGMNGAVQKAKELAIENKKVFLARQFENSSNIKAHYITTGPEIEKDLKGKVDVFLAGFGTSGTIIGCSKYFKEKNLGTKIIGIEPASSPLMTQKRAGSHKIQGIGANFVPKLYDSSLVDEVIDITNEEAFEGTNLLALKEGLFCGISSGAATIALTKLDKQLYKGKNVVIVLPDNGERYLSVGGLFN